MICVFFFHFFTLFLVWYDLTWLSLKDQKSSMLDFGMLGKKKKKMKCHFFFLLDLISARRRTSSTKQYSESCLTTNDILNKFY